MIWLVLAVMTGLAALAVIWPLSLRRSGRELNDRETAFYRAQLREIDRDVERGQLPMEEAQTARAEAARRLIAANAQQPQAAAPAVFLGRRRLASAVILVAVPLIALLAYARVGRPSLPDAPLADRSVDPRTPEGVRMAIAKIETELAKHPDDLRGWQVLGPIYMRLGRFDDAATAYRQILRLAGDAAATEADFGEALLAAADGVVVADARQALERALQLDAKLPKARFYLALAAEQDGDKAKAQAVYESLQSEAQDSAPWMMVLKARLAALHGEPAATADANFTPEQQTMIRGMVQGLAERLAHNGGSAEEWARLIRAYTVLKEPDKAKAALADAHKAYANDATATADLDALARELGLGG